MDGLREERKKKNKYSLRHRSVAGMRLRACFACLALLAGPLTQASAAATMSIALIERPTAPETSNQNSRETHWITTPDVVTDNTLVPYRVAVNNGVSVQLAVTGDHGAEPLKMALPVGGNIAVLYPDIGEPYRSVFSRIIEGIEDKAHAHVSSYAVSANSNMQELSGELKRQDVRVIIALGRHGIKAATALDSGNSINIVAGGVLTVPDSDARDMSVYSLAPDPGLLFARLKGLMPQVRRVFTVYDPHQNNWLMQLALSAAKTQGIELVALQAPDLKSAMQQYQSLLVGVDSKRDALWLPQDSTTVEDSAVLPLVLQEAWDKNLAVFSSSVAHVKRGVLFSLFPDNKELGRNLATSALHYLSSDTTSTRGMLPLKDVLIAVNLRTASHLGLNIKAQQSFDLVFPEP